MFNSILELIKEIDSGKDTKEIVGERLEYLKSDEYQSQMYKGNNSDHVEFLQGYIGEKEVIGFGAMNSTSYWMDEENLYAEIIDGVSNFLKDESKREKIEKSGQLPMTLFLNAVKKYFFNTKPSAESVQAYEAVASKMDQNALRKSIETSIMNNPTLTNGKSEEYIQKMVNQAYRNAVDNEVRENFGEAYNEQILNSKTGKEGQELKDKYEDLESKGNFVPVPISAIKGLGIAQCTEMAMLSQNLLSFFGYDAFMVQGKADNETGRAVDHNFNAIKKGDNFVIFDSALQFFGIAKDAKNADKEAIIETPEDLLTFGEMTVMRPKANKDDPDHWIKYVSNRSKERYSNPMDKMKILSKKGEQYKDSVSSDMERIKMSQKIMSREGEERND